jgi:hypothetical protein
LEVASRWFFHKMKNTLLLLSLLATQLTFSLDASAGLGGERDMKRVRPRERGNERSERVTSLQVGAPVYAGNGCTQGTMAAVFAPDNLSFSILFDGFIAELSKDVNKKKDVMNCGVVIPMQIPEGMQLSITRVDYRGFMNLPEGVRGVFRSSYSFNKRERNVEKGDGANVNLNYQFVGPKTEDYFISSDVLGDGTSGIAETSPCGGNVRLRINSAVKIAGPKGAEGQITLDSMDGSGSENAVYYVNWQKCTDPDRRPGDGHGNGNGNGRGNGGGREGNRDTGRDDGRGNFFPGQFGGHR